jgi:nitrite reductase/ring-hydroxylating ferredoxin subunit
VETWHLVGREADFELELVEEVAVGGGTVAVHPTPAGFFATSAICTHEEARLYDGLLEGVEIQCPRHLARFDVRDGRPLCAPAEIPLRTYPCKVIDGEVWVWAPDQPSS